MEIDNYWKNGLDVVEISCHDTNYIKIFEYKYSIHFNKYGNAIIAFYQCTPCKAPLYEYQIESLLVEVLDYSV